jgi:hypothetical protein
MSEEFVVREAVSESRKISTAQYESRDLFASRSIEFKQSDIPEDTTLNQFCNDQRRTAFNELQEELDYQESRIRHPELKKSFPKHHRFTMRNGIRFPHVTNIISYDKEEQLNRIPDLNLHAQVGTALDWSCKRYVEEGILLFNEDHGLDNGWLEKYLDCLSNMNKVLKKAKKKIDLRGHSQKIIDEQHRYAGELDAFGLYDGVESVFDFKKTKQLSKAICEGYFMQMAAYARGSGLFFERLVILSPYNPPKVCDAVDEYFEKFLEKRKGYKETYGI